MSNTVVPLLTTQAIKLKEQSDVTVNNIANGKTSGFKSDSVVVRAFPDYLEDGEMVSYPVGWDTAPDLTQGSLRPTEDPYNVALNGPGFFTLEGGVYARDGALLQNVDGILVNLSGLPFLDAGGNPITIPSGARISISREGTISTPEGVIAKLGVVSFLDERLIQKQGDSLYVTNQDPIPLENPSILQGFLEHSNVQVVKETVDFTDYTISYQEGVNMIDQSYKTNSELVQKLLKV